MGTYTAVDAKMAAIPQNQTSSTVDIAAYIATNFNSDADKIRAAFFWVASNISYDVASLNQQNFNYTPEEKIASALKNRKGVCIHYAEVFNDIANKIGVKTYIISGYTKQYGKVDAISHAWNASKVGGKWQLYDPTWAAGYVNGQQFTKKFNNDYFAVAPAKHVLSHMPFDYMWQFLVSPVTNKEFVSGKMSAEKRTTNYDFASEIQKYEALPSDEKAFETAQRVEKNGVVNNLISVYLDLKKNEANVLRQNQNIAQLNDIVVQFNAAVGLLNDFVTYRNNRFKPAFPDETIAQMIALPVDQLKKCQKAVYAIGPVGKDNTASLNSLKNAINDTAKQALDHQAFVKEYLTKSPGQRKGMFVKKTTWFGVPVR